MIALMASLQPQPRLFLTVWTGGSFSLMEKFTRIWCYRRAYYTKGQFQAQWSFILGGGRGRDYLCFFFFFLYRKTIRNASLNHDNALPPSTLHYSAWLTTLKVVGHGQAPWRRLRRRPLTHHNPRPTRVIITWITSQAEYLKQWCIAII